MLAFIGTLQPRCKTAILSNAWEGAREEMEDHINSQTFDAIVYSSEVGLLKPDPEIYRRTLALMGIQAQEAIFVDDVQRNVDGANRIGLHGIVFKDSQQAKQGIEALLDNP